MTPQQLILQEKLKAVHEYVRHLFGLVVQWFIFFATVNYATMGWLAKPSGTPPATGGLIWLVALVFVTQNVLAIIICIIARAHILRRAALADDIEQQLIASVSGASPPPLSGVPIDIYSISMIFMVIALTPLLIAWVSFPFLLQ